MEWECRHHKRVEPQYRWLDRICRANRRLYQVGFAVNDIVGVTELTHAILIDQANNNYTVYEGSTATSYGGWQVGDVFRISREEHQVKYYRNGIVVRTVATNQSQLLKVKTILRIVGKTTPAITTSFDSQLILQGTVIGLDGESGSGEYRAECHWRHSPLYLQLVEW